MGVLIGRQGENAPARRPAPRGTGGPGSALDLRGESGIGGSALLRHLDEAATG